jgi:transposase
VLFDVYKKSVYGDENIIYVKKLTPEEDGAICKVLCISEGKARKERAIAIKKDSKRDNRFLQTINNFNRSIKKGSIKKLDKIEAKLARIRASHRLASTYYETVIQKNEAGAAIKIDLIAKEKPPQEDKLYGCYVLETTHIELTDVVIWNLYMTLSSVESAFRSMKEELGMRPVYHQTGKRTEAHLFITVLAYHILAMIKNTLRQQGDHRQWETIRDDLTTHTRSTVIMKDKDGNVYHTRVSGTPEDIHEDIYKKLGVSDPLKVLTSLVKTA